MRRFRYVLVMLAALLLAPALASSATICQDTFNGRICTAQVDFGQFTQQAFQNQLQSQWCWAASISMLFTYANHPLGQSRIVSEAYGAPANIPAPGIVMARQLNRDWTDDRGQRFLARISGMYDADAGVLALTNAQIIAELDRGRPLVIGAGSHAMVLTAIQYYNTVAGPVVVAGGVFDPWPGVGARVLQPQELVPMHLGGSLRFLAAVNVTDSTQGPSDSASSDESGGGSYSLMLVLALVTLATARIAAHGNRILA